MPAPEASADLAPGAAPRPAPLPLRLAARLPLSVLYGLATITYWLMFRIGHVRTSLVRRQISESFPALSRAEVGALADIYYRRFADMLFETLKAFAMSREELLARVNFEGLDEIRARLAGGQSVLLVTAHHCNWEWLLLAISAALGYPVDVAYKPLRSPLAERIARWSRTRFGARLVPAKGLLADLLKHRGIVRAVSMAADQVPSTSPTREWLTFLDRDTAFYTGAEALARALRFPVYIVLMERTARGYYRARIELLAEAGSSTADDSITRRYARRLDAHLREHPADWLWSHNRWKTPRPLYAGPGAGR